MPEIDEKILEKLLNEPSVKPQVDKMTPAELRLFKELLVSQGIYARYVKENS